MSKRQTRRRFFATLSSAGLAGVVAAQKASAIEPPLETTKITLAQISGICIAPQYVAEELLKLEGFTDIQYLQAIANSFAAVASGQADLSMAFVAPLIVQADAGMPIVLLGGVHTGCFELFGAEHVRAVRDLKDKVVAVPEPNSAHQLFVASLATYVGLDPARDIKFVFHPPADSIGLLADGKIDALMGFPPLPQELRERKIGRVIMNSGSDRPWSQYSCCVVAATREFVQKHPVAAKRALRAILKATDYCAAEPERAAQMVASRGYRYDYALQTLREISYARWREYDVEDAVRFYSLRLREAGMIKSSPNKIISQVMDLRLFNELKA